MQELGLVIQRYDRFSGWGQIAVTTTKTAKRDLKMYKDADTTSLYRVYNKDAKRVVYQ
jgi:hypothetical protein